MKQMHGGNIFAYDIKYDFSANLNPLGMPESVKKAILESVPLWEHYPDPDCTALVRKLSAYEGVPAEQIVCGNGADDLIYRIAAAFRPGKALLCAPSFGEYRKALMEQDCCIRTHFLREENVFSLTDAYFQNLTLDLDMAMLCTPNNPTGQCIPAGLLEQIIDECCRNDILLLIDGCFLDFTEGGGQQLNHLLRRNVILLKAFTKSFAVPGLRLGYVLCGCPEMASKIRETGQFWSVSAPAQAAGLAALEEQDYLRKTRKLICQERLFLITQFIEMGIKVFPSDANFLLFRSVENLAEALLREGILIRLCENFQGLDGRFYRIAVRTHPENLALMEGLRRCLYGESHYAAGNNV